MAEPVKGLSRLPSGIALDGNRAKVACQSCQYACFEPTTGLVLRYCVSWLKLHLFRIYLEIHESVVR